MKKYLLGYKNIYRTYIQHRVIKLKRLCTKEFLFRELLLKNIKYVCGQYINFAYRLPKFK